MAAKSPAYVHSFRYPIDTLGPKETILEKWSELAVHPVLLQFGFGANDCLLRYAAYIGEGSGLHQAIPDWTERKKEALRLAGILATHPHYQAILEVRHEPTQELRWAWLKIFSSRKMRAYVAGCEAYDQNCRKVESRIDEKPASKSEISAEEAAALMAAGGGMKEDAVQRAYKLRNELLQGLPTQDALLSKLETEMFMGDEEMKRLATERAKPQAETGSIEEKIMNRKTK